MLRMVNLYWYMHILKVELILYCILLKLLLLSLTHFHWQYFG